MNDETRDAVALVLFAARCRSRHTAKRKLRDLGLGAGRAADLDALLAQVAALPDAVRDDIEERVSALQRAHAATEAAMLRRRRPDDPLWIIGADAARGDDYVVYIGPDTSFMARLFESPAAAQAAGSVGELVPLDLGEALGDVTWLDGEVPDHNERAALYRATRDARGAARLRRAAGQR